MQSRSVVLPLRTVCTNLYDKPWGTDTAVSRGVRESQAGVWTRDKQQVQSYLACRLQYVPNLRHRRLHITICFPGSRTSSLHRWYSQLSVHIMTSNFPSPSSRCVVVTNSILQTRELQTTQLMMKVIATADERLSSMFGDMSRPDSIMVSRIYRHLV